MPSGKIPPTTDIGDGKDTANAREGVDNEAGDKFPALFSSGVGALEGIKPGIGS